MSDYQQLYEQKVTEFEELNEQFLEYQGTWVATQSRAISSSQTSSRNLRISAKRVTFS